MKNKNSQFSACSRRAVCAVLYTLCGLIWLGKGARDPAGLNWFHMALGLVWLAGEGIWTVRAWREWKEGEP